MNIKESYTQKRKKSLENNTQTQPKCKRNPATKTGHFGSTKGNNISKYRHKSN